MTDIHVPDEVVEAVARLKAVKYSEQYDSDPEKIWPTFVDEARAEITAALAEWVECGMAKEGNGFYFPDGKIGANEIEKLTTVPNTFPVLILKTTEAT